MTEKPRSPKPVLSPKLAAYLADMQTARRQIARNGQIIRDLIDGNDCSKAAVEEVIERINEEAFSTIPNCDVPMTSHRTKRRRGRIPKIDDDPNCAPSFLPDWTN